MSSNPVIVNLLPENAPFTPDQRIWLSGLFAGLLGIGQAATPLSPDEAAALVPEILQPPAGAAEGPITWHDPGIPIDQRMKLAEGRSLHMRLMAAMAQQDCGQCGSSCEDYSRQIFEKAEARLNLCVPGGKGTSRVLKKLMEEALSITPSPEAAVSAPAEAKPAA